MSILMRGLGATPEVNFEEKDFNRIKKKLKNTEILSRKDVALSVYRGLVPQPDKNPSPSMNIR